MIKLLFYFSATVLAILTAAVSLGMKVTSTGGLMGTYPFVIFMALCALLSFALFVKELYR